ncbi:MAG: hypothetical protein L3J88_09415 [Gammaproteobacteria bacterium]|nr:hypothetical protein [Gammaproteobacteria bacterium]MCF6363541.1 hypothetical protein [Gammaproteobacteria bacterium]
MNNNGSEQTTLKTPLQQALPWLAGAGFALSHIALTSNCTVPREGHCSTCGSCVVALGAIVAWAVLKNRPVDAGVDLADKA